MRSRERILATLAGQPADVQPVAIDYLMLYLEERIERCYVDAYCPRLERSRSVRIDPDEDAEIRARAVMEAYTSFHERCDWMQLRLGPGRETLAQTMLVLEAAQVFEVNLESGARRQMLLAGEASKTEEMRDLFERSQRGAAMLARLDLDALIAEHRQRIRAERGDPKPVELVVAEQGKEYFLYTGVSTPIVYLYTLVGFESMLLAMLDAPDAVLYLLDHLLESGIEIASAFKAAGGDAVRVEDAFTGADIVSPAMYERFALPYQQRLLGEIRKMGLKAFLSMTGNVMPRLPWLRDLPLDALMVEESKKDFVIDIGEVRAAVGPKLCLVGNLDAYGIVHEATEADLAAEVARQIRLAGHGSPFIVGMGSPITLDTPPARVDLLVRRAHEHRGQRASL